MRLLGCLILSLLMAQPSHAKEGVILLHGLARTSASMTTMEKALSQAGFVVENVDYPSRTASIGVLGESVIGAALQSESLRDCSQIHFVTHSLGGLLVRAYFSDHQDSRLGRVVMLGPPNHGSEVADKLDSWWLYQKINGPAGNELRTATDAKPAQLGPVDFELGVIAGDRSINWINSLMIPGSDDGKVSVESTKVEGMKDHLVIHATHPYLMKNKQAIQATVTFLQSGSFHTNKLSQGRDGRPCLLIHLRKSASSAGRYPQSK